MVTLMLDNTDDEDTNKLIKYIVTHSITSLQW